MKRISYRLVLVVAILLTLAACGGGEEVGSGVGVNEEGGASGALRDTTTTQASVDLSATTTTAKAATTTAPPRVTTTAAPVATTTTAPQNIVKIQDDEQGAALEPRQFRVPRGATVTWQNTSAKGATRQIAAENNTFVSPQIPPGGSWSWTANVAPQVINYRDTTRPYAVAAQLQVY